jgi:DNA-binding transcriptional LysR family regulator
LICPGCQISEGLAIFAKVVETRSFAGAAAELNLSKATVSKAVSRIESKLKARLFNRTSRRIALTDEGRQLAGRAAHILAEGDAMVDVIGEGFDAAIRIAVPPDSSLVARRLCEMPRYLVGSPAYLNKHGRPKHPLHLAQHRCIGYSYAMTAEIWRFTKSGKSASVRPSGPLRVNNGDAMMPALIAGTGLGILPEFILRDTLAADRLERLLPDWSLPSGAVYWVTPPGGPRPKRVEVLADFLVEKLAAHTGRGTQAAPGTPARSTG